MRPVTVLVHLDLFDDDQRSTAQLERAVADAIRWGGFALAVDAELVERRPVPAEDVPACVRLDENVPQAVRRTLPGHDQRAVADALERARMTARDRARADGWMT